MIKRILVGLSGTPYTPVAVEYALELARRHEATITGVTITDIKRLAYVGSVPVGAISVAHDLEQRRIQITEERVEQVIGEFERQCADKGIGATVARESGDPLDELMSLWRYHDLTVLGLRGLFEYGVVHNPDDTLLGLIRHGVRPILAVSATHRPVSRVLIAYNGSMESAKAMKRFVQTRLWERPAVKIVCFDRKPAEADQLLADAASYCGAHGLSPETERIEGGPRQRLLPTATGWNADLIVMGSTSRARFFQHLLGDTVLSTVHGSEIPLFLSQ